METCKQYSVKWQIAIMDEDVNKVIRRIIIANSGEHNSQRKDLVYHYLPCNRNLSRIKVLLDSDTRIPEYDGNRGIQRATKSDKEIEEIAVNIFEECSKIESVKQLQQARNYIDNKLEELIKSLELAIRFINN